MKDEKLRFIFPLILPPSERGSGNGKELLQSVFRFKNAQFERARVVRRVKLLCIRVVLMA